MEIDTAKRLSELTKKSDLFNRDNLGKLIIEDLTKDGLYTPNLLFRGYSATAEEIHETGMYLFGRENFTSSDFKDDPVEDERIFKSVHGDFIFCGDEFNLLDSEESPENPIRHIVSARKPSLAVFDGTKLRSVKREIISETAYEFIDPDNKIDALVRLYKF